MRRRRLLAPVLALFAVAWVLLAGCAFRQADMCTMAADRDMAPAWLDEASAQRVWNGLLEELHAKGYRVVWVEGADRATTYRKVIVLPARYKTAKLWERAKLLAHETVHARQWRRIKRFGWRYITSPAFRVEVEGAATREEIRLLRRWRNEGVAEDEAAKLVRQLAQGYAAGGAYDPDRTYAALLGPRCVAH